MLDCFIKMESQELTEKSTSQQLHEAIAECAENEETLNKAPVSPP